MLEVVPWNAQRVRRSAVVAVLLHALAIALTVQLPGQARAQEAAPPTSTAADWTDADLATAAALRDRALKGASAYDQVSSLVTEVGHGWRVPQAMRRRFAGP